MGAFLMRHTVTIPKGCVYESGDGSQHSQAQDVAFLFGRKSHCWIKLDRTV